MNLQKLCQLFLWSEKAPEKYNYFKAEFMSSPSILKCAETRTVKVGVGGSGFFHLERG